jgi:hypothetical protein
LIEQISSGYIGFVYHNNQTGLKQKFRFSLQHYRASQGEDNYTDSANNPEGAYEFKPKRYERFQFPYGNISTRDDDDIKYFAGSVIYQYEFMINGSAIVNDTDTMKAMIRVRHSKYT